MDIHVRLVVGQTCVYAQYPDRVCKVACVHDLHVPITYDIQIPLYEGTFDGRFLYARGISPRQLRAVDEIRL
jgi:hypothetical protein